MSDRHPHPMHSVRPERISIVPEGRPSGEAPEVEVSATVLDVQYLGAACRVRTRLDDGSTLVANVPSEGLVGVAVGGSVRLAWPRAAAFPVATTTDKSDISEGAQQ